MGKSNTILAQKSDKSMLDWQYKMLLAELQQLQLHMTDATCPCSLSSINEWCVPKHLLSVASLAQETAAMDPDHYDMLIDLGTQATEKHNAAREVVCGSGSIEILDWARGWRKRIEPLYYACDFKASGHPSGSVLGKIEEILGPLEYRSAQIEAGEINEYSLEIPVSYEQASRASGRRLIRQRMAKVKREITSLDPEAVIRAGFTVGTLTVKTRAKLKRIKSVRGVKIERVRKPVSHVRLKNLHLLTHIPFKQLKYQIPEPDPYIHKLESFGRGVTEIIPPEFSRLDVTTRLVRDPLYDPEKSPKITTPEDTQPFFRLMRLADREYLMAILLDTGNRCVGLFIVNLGTRDSATVAIDAIIRSAILANAGGIILAHNHPSGQVNPSKQDEELLHTMERAGAPFKISILDMIVVGSIQDYSIQGKRRMSAPVFAQDVKMPVPDSWGSRCRDPNTGHWTHAEFCPVSPDDGYSPAGDELTWATGVNQMGRYEFIYKVYEADELIPSHDPFTFQPNRKFPPELQPRLRERAAPRVQVERIAANLDPGLLLEDFHSLDRGAPIIGPDKAVESGNGRVMAIARAAKLHADIYDRYKQSLIVIAPRYGQDPDRIEKMKTPVLVRERLTDVVRTSFVEEGNATTSIGRSTVEIAQSDAKMITTPMLDSLLILENETIEDALRATRNKRFVTAFLSKIPGSEQASLLDSQGTINQDGIRRAATAIFVRVFSTGDAGLRLAEKWFESTEPDIKNVFNGIARSLGILARAESLISEGQRDAGLSIAEDLADTIAVYSKIRGAGMRLEDYLNQSQLWDREITDFQEKMLVALHDRRRSAKKIGALLYNYASLVIDQPPPEQGSLMPTEPVSKEDIWERALRMETPEAVPALSMFSGRIPRRIRMRQLDWSQITGTALGMVGTGIAAGIGEAIGRSIARKTGLVDSGFGEGELIPPGYEDVTALLAGEFQAQAVDAPTKPEKKIDQVLAQLKEGVRTIQNSEEFRRLLVTMSRFHDYSLGNQILIMLQRPDATRVAGYRTWQDLGRYVRKGEKGIAILAPIGRPRAVCPECGAKLPRRAITCPECGAAVDSREQTRLTSSPTRFIVVHVFDISQTEGEPLPEIDVPTLSGEANPLLFNDLLDTLAKQGIKVNFDSKPDQDSAIKGFFQPPDFIWVRPEEPRAQQLKTLIHEAAHYYTEGVFRIPRADAETIAESVAFVVGAHFGFDTGARSFPYVAIWAREPEVLDRNLATIRDISVRMMEDIAK